ncbi:MAG: hypothetical protein HY287_05565 [Planctomycetes bacterium]|nr:hypothetical protein [Planctomycetota bacterium]MBI3833779.1 hypothetical protein [Planctomycetota bacterium]
MGDIPTILEQATLFVQQHAPADILRQAVPAGVSLLILGILLSVLGAKFARFGFSTFFILLGASAGLAFARERNFQPLAGAAVGAALVGAFGFLTFRLWVGALTGIVLCLAAAGFFGYYNVIPHVGEFEQTTGIMAAKDSGANTFTIPTPEQQQAYRDRSPSEWASRFWSYIREHHWSSACVSETIAAVALLSGLCIGLLATRAALIITTSLVGTSLVTAGMATLLTHSVPQSCQAFQQNPGLIGIGLGGFLLTSLVLQFMLSRKGAIKSSQPAPA